MDKRINLKEKLRQLEDHATPLNTEVEWKRLERRLDEKKKRRFIMFFITFITCIATMLMVFEINKMNLTATSKLNKNISTSEHFVEITTPIDLQTGQNADLSKIETNNSIDNKKAKLNPSTKTSNLDTNININAEAILFVNEKFAPTIYHSSDEILQNEKPLLHESLDQTNIDPGVNETQNLTPKSFFKENFLPSIDISLSWKNAKIEFNKKKDFTILPFTSPVEKPIITQNNKHLVMEFTMKTGLPMARFNAIGGEKNILALRQDYEKPLESISADVLLSKKFGETIEVNGGVSYIRVRENMHLMYNYQKTSNENNINSIIENVDGSNTPISSDNVLVVRNYKREVLKTNVYSGIGANLALTKKLWQKLYLRGGFHLLFYNNYNGGVVFKTNEVMPMEDIIKTSTSTWLALDLFYTSSLTENLNLKYGINYMHQLNGLREIQNSYKQNYSIYNLSLGIQMRL